MIRAFGSLSVALLVACASDPVTEGCGSDADCTAPLICEDGSCICRTDDMCGSGEYCNPFGTCQPRPACLGNHDCDDGEICNSAAGECIPEDSCGSDLHCPLNHICTAAMRCEPRCRSAGDCELGTICSGGECTLGATAADCMRCPSSPTPDSSYCDYGEACSPTGDCEPHADQSGLCQKPCDADHPCDASLTCLVDDDGGNYCAPSCTTDRDCPSGYEGCGSLGIVSLPCGDPGAAGPCECTNTGACPNGGKCVGSGEGNRAYCECVSQDDCNFLRGACFFNTCQTPGGGSCSRDEDCGCEDNRCLVGGFPCSSAADCIVSCIQFPFGDTTYGRCQTNAKACGKGEGVSCTELTTGEAECRAN